MPSSTSSFERAIPARPWPRLALVAALLTLVAAVAWEIRCRAWGYGPTLNDSSDLWAQRRRAVRSDSLVIIGDSRAFFDLDLDQLESALGQRPVQLALPGSTPYPILAELAADQSFRGTIICSVVPGMFVAPGGPLMERSQTALERHEKGTLAHRAGHHLAMFLEERVAFLKEQDLTLEVLLKKLPIPNRPGTGRPPMPPYFQTVDRERRARMTEECAQPGPLQDRIKYGWLPLFTPPRPPPYLTREVFLAGLHKGIEARYRDTAAAVARLRARGAKVVFVRFPVTGELKKAEDRTSPRATTWDRILKETGAPGIHFEDHPELASFDCPEWSHLSAPDSVEFTRRLGPHLRKALGR